MTASPHRPAAAPSDPLDAVRLALLEDAEAEAEEIVGAATDDGAAVVERARQDADAAVDQARRRAEATSAANAALVTTRARRDAHARVLRAHEQLHREVVGRVRAAFERARDDPRYPSLLDRLTAIAIAELGEQAIVERDPRPGGGVVAVDGSRRVDLRLAALADRALEQLGDEVGGLWS